ncbi:GtrA family protein [Candidatus Micrarchaeota archaeon]|nr:GtrA family protein [Candidatus Micrarchaeota archaeon]
MIESLLSQRPFRFALVGGLGATLNLAILYLIGEFGGVHYVVAGFLSSQVSLTFNFIANDSWTFAGKKKHTFISRFFRYWLISHGTILLDLLILYILTGFLSVYYVFSMLVAILISAAINYFMNKKHTFPT